MAVDLDPAVAIIAYIYRAYDFPCIDGTEEERVEAECAANAALLLAAPDLLAACIAAVADIPAHYRVRAVLSAAIAKARGQ